jgi:deoxyribonuclease-1
MIMKLTLSTFAIAAFFVPLSFASGENVSIQSFNKAKKLLERNVYPNHRKTLYCGAVFDEKKNVKPPSGFESEKYKKRAKRIEWEHVVPAENFGRAYPEWREGHKSCVSSKGKAFKGRKCAEKVNLSYRYMQSDMYNLYPAIGSVNALRSNYNFTMLPATVSSFGSCEMKIENRKAEPPIVSRGRIARTYLYMSDTYPKFSLSKQQKQLMNAWDKQYPVSEWECKRAKKIANIQKNKNLVVESRCDAVGI